MIDEKRSAQVPGSPGELERGPASALDAPVQPNRIPFQPFASFVKFAFAALVVYLLARSTGYPDVGLRLGEHRQDTKSDLASRISSDAFDTYRSCSSLPPPALGSYMTRREKLSNSLETLHDGSDIYITEPSPSGSYYANVSGTTWHLSERPFLIVIAPKITDEVIILTPRFEADRARILPISVDTRVGKGVKYVEWREEESPYAVLVSALGFPSLAPSDSAHEQVKIHLDPLTRLFISSGIQKELNIRGLDEHVKVEIADLEVLSIRERKTEEELALLKCANELTIHAIRMTKQDMYLGIKESETSAILSGHMDSLGLVGGGGLILFGENAALPHGSGTDKALGKHDLALIDAGGSFRGYVSDITRTFALPETKLSKTQLRLWDTVANAQAAALLAGVEGATGNEIDRAARDVVEQAGLRDVEREGFSHRLGHGIGLEGHEAPYLVGSNDIPIQTGNAFSDEPGIYILNEVGVRLEDCWYVGEDGVGKLFTGPAKSVYEP